MIRRWLFAVAAALLIGLVLLTDSDAWWRFDFIYLAGPLLLTAGLAARLGRAADRPGSSPPELRRVMLAGGFGLSLLFWLRAALGLPAIALADIGLLMAVILSGPAPALALTLLHDSLARPAGEPRSPLRSLLATVIAGWTGCVLGLAAAQQLDGPPLREQRREPGSLPFLLIRPSADPRLLSALPLVDRLQLDPESLLFHRPDHWQARNIQISGRSFGLIRRDLSHPAYAVELRSLSPERVQVSVAGQGGHALIPLRPGPAVIEARMGRQLAHMVVWMLADAAGPTPVVDVTAGFEITLAQSDRVPPEGVLAAASRALTLTWRGDQPLAGPLFAIIEAPEGIHINTVPAPLARLDGHRALVRLPADTPRTAAGQRAPVHLPGRRIRLSIALDSASSEWRPETSIRVLQSLEAPVAAAFDAQ